MSAPEHHFCPADGCHLPAVEVAVREVDKYLHELTGTCKRGHIWTTKWFAEAS